MIPLENFITASPISTRLSLVKGKVCETLILVTFMLVFVHLAEAQQLRRFQIHRKLKLHRPDDSAQRASESGQGDQMKLVGNQVSGVRFQQKQERQ